MMCFARFGVRDVIGFAVGQGGPYLRALGVLAVGEETEPNLFPDAEGDATPGGSTPPGTGLPKRRPRLSTGPIQHPLPDLSEEEAAKIARKLADERARLDEQSARGLPDKSAPASQPPPPAPHAFLPAQRRAKLMTSRLSSEPPWKGPAAEPSWHVLGTMVGLLPEEEGDALGLMSLDDRQLGGPAAETEARADESGTDLALADPAPTGVEPADAEHVADAVAQPTEAGDALEVSTDPAIASVRDTFAIVGAAGDDAAAYFYGWLFAGHPELRALFPTAMNEQRDRLFRALGRIVRSLSSPEELAAYLTQLGRDHRKYSVEPEMYDAVGDALMATLRAYAGPAFTPAAKEAWAQAYQAASSLMIDSANSDSLNAPPFWTAEVVGNEQRRPDISILTVASYLPLPYEPGQHLTVQTPRWPKVWRPYSMACRPREDGLLAFHIKAVPGGWVSNALVHHTEPGTELILGPALGTMTLRQAGGRDLLCVAGGTGLSPIKAIIEQAIKESADCPRQIHLFYGARTREDLYDLPELWHLADAYQGLQLTPVTSDDPAFDGMQGNVGRVAARYMPHRECEAYVAGPPAMVRETLGVLTKSGLPRGRIHYDDALLADDEPPEPSEQPE
jgi:NAD(P)H-flavin reductase/hemoglobin-like flavoprotein